MNIPEIDFIKCSDGSLEVVNNFCFLGNVISKGNYYAESRVA